MTPAAELRERQLALHARAVIWHSIMAHEYDRIGMPAKAQEASQLAEANCRALRWWEGPTNHGTGDNSRTAD